MKTVFIPLLNQSYYLGSKWNFSLTTIKENINFLDALNLLPGCATLSYWKRNCDIMTVNVELPVGQFLRFLDMKNGQVKVSVAIGERNKMYNFVADLAVIDGLILKDKV